MHGKQNNPSKICDRNIVNKIQGTGLNSNEADLDTNFFENVEERNFIPCYKTERHLSNTIKGINSHNRVVIQ